jgi:hypothetical protein
LDFVFRINEKQRPRSMLFIPCAVRSRLEDVATEGKKLETNKPRL